LVAAHASTKPDGRYKVLGNKRERDILSLI